MTAFSGQLGKETRQAGDFLTSADEVLFSSASPGIAQTTQPIFEKLGEGARKKPSRSLLVILFF